MKQQSILKQHALFFELIFKIFDIFIVFFSSFLAYILHGDILQPYESYIQGVLITLFIAMIVFQSMGLYKPWRGSFLYNEIKVVFLSWCILFLILALIMVITKSSEFYSRGWFIIWWVCGLSMSIVMRVILRTGLRQIRKLGFNQRQIVIIGSNDFAIDVIHRLQAEKSGGFDIHGLFTDTPIKHTQEIKNLGELKDIYDYVEAHRIDQVWITMTLSDGDKVKQVINHLRHTTVDVLYIPDIFGLSLLNHSFSDVAGLPVINLASSPMVGTSRMAKDIEDKLVSSIILLLILPLLIVITIGVKLSSPGPILFRQKRIGWNKDEITILKFRSMPVDIEKNTGPVWAGQHEKRATKFGLFLRKTSLDELPQFINVLKGEMSIVGPRPERPHFVEKFKDEIPGYMKKHMVKAGITGLAQINGWRGNTDIKKRIEYDLYYIENWSLWLDFKIIIHTLFRGFIHKNAY